VKHDTVQFSFNVSVQRQWLRGAMLSATDLQRSFSYNRCHFYFRDNFGKRGPNLIILSPMHSAIHCGISSS